MEFIQVLVLGLATWRLAYFIVEEAGPWNVMGKLRPKMRRYAWLNPDCMDCTSAEIAFIAALFLGFHWYPVHAFAIGAISLLLQAIYSKIE